MDSQANLKSNRGLIAATFALLAIIVIGILWLFMLSPAERSGFGWYLFSFATGLTMIVLPCTLPLAFVIVPLSMGKGIRKGLGIALSFGIGIAITLSLYGVIAAIVGKAAIGGLGTPLETVKNWVYFIAGIFAYLFALGEVGLIKFKMPTYTGAAPSFIQKQQDYLKALLLGLFLGNIGVGCPHPATPLILVEIASSANVFYGWTLFLVHAIGRILPLLLLAMLGIAGINGLSWLVARKDRIERATGWAMVFVAGFILVLGLFTHDWWVNSGIHTQLEKVTQEETLLTALGSKLGTENVHQHGPEEGPALFGLPLALGNWALVLLWCIPIWWWYARKRRELMLSPSIQLSKIEKAIDALEAKRRSIEGNVKLDDIETKTDLKGIEGQLDALEKTRREAEAAVQYGEQGILKEPLARNYEMSLLKHKRSIFALVTVLLAFVFIYYLPHNFLEHESKAHANGHMTEGMHEMTEDHPHDGDDMSSMDHMMGDEHEHDGTETADHAHTDAAVTDSGSESTPHAHDAVDENEATVAAEALKVSLTTLPATLASDEKANLTFFVQHQSGTPADDLEIEHEKLMHVIGVREDLTQFMHLHPDRVAPGTFDLDAEFSEPGRYTLWTDITRKGAKRAYKLPTLTVTDGNGSVPGRLTAVPVFNATTSVSGYTVEFAKDPFIDERESSHVGFAISDARGNRIKLEPFLAADMHLAVIKDDLSEYIHTHPSGHHHGANNADVTVRLVPRAYAHGGIPDGHLEVADADVVFEVIFPSAGIYKLFAQFRPEGISLPSDQSLVAEFFVRVNEKDAGFISGLTDATKEPPSRTVMATISLVLMAVLSFGISRYLKKP